VSAESGSEGGGGGGAPVELSSIGAERQQMLQR